MKCWIITEGLVGTENQCLGVAEALGINPEVKRVNLRQPWKSFSPFLGCERASSFEPELTGPWPDLLLASGRKSIAAARYIKKASNGKTFTVQIQDPRISPANFDLVALPEHDPTRGKNVMTTAASPNRITDGKLASAKERYRNLFEKLKFPRIAVLVGGQSKHHSLPPQLTRMLADQLKKLDAGLMITTSRRTGEENRKILHGALEGPNTFIWDTKSDNPYFGMLAWADYIIVTEDSSSMISDAATTGKPVYVVPLAGGSKRHEKLLENLSNRGIIRLFTGKLESWTYQPLRDAQKIADEIRVRLAGHGRN